MYRLYNLIYTLILPFLLIRLYWRGRRLAAYRQRWRERFGYYSRPTLSQSIWIHAVSYGEAVAAERLISALLTQYPNIPIVATTTTPTGSERLQKTFAKQIIHCYAPYDYTGAVTRFLQFSRPKLAIIMETELWPTVLHQLKAQKIPCVIANARLSLHSMRRYQRILSFTRLMLSGVSQVLAQTLADADRFIALGLPPNRVSITGSIKWDAIIPKELQQQGQRLRQQIGLTRPVWVAASTHAGEEEIIFAAHQQVLQQHPNALLILAPRHPQRFAEVTKHCQQHHITTIRSQHTPITPETQVLLADTLGELFIFYECADVAFVGGSLVPIGGHNVLEPAALSRPIITGPHLDNFVDPCTLLKKAQALTVIESTPQLATAVNALFTNKIESKEQGQRAYTTVLAHRGSIQKQLAAIEQLLNCRNKRKN